jgi:short-subunit dehydrogenase
MQCKQYCLRQDVIDVLVNNAGYGLNGAFEDLAIDEIKAQYETNVFGLIRTTQAVLPIMRYIILPPKCERIISFAFNSGNFSVEI